MATPNKPKQLRTGGKTGPKTGAVQKQPKKKRQGKMNNPLIASGKQQMTYRIPDCVTHYYEALTNPFNTEAGACLPCDLFPLPSYKARVFIRTTIGLSLQGVAFVAATPTIANDAAAIQTSTSLSVGGLGTAFNAFTNVQNLVCLQNQYTSAQITASQVGCRIVSFGIRVKYIGNLANRNGAVVCYEDPDGLDTRSKSYNSTSSDPYASLKRVGPDPWDCEVCYSGPVRPSDLEFQYIIYPNFTNAPLIVAISGSPGDTYEIEYFQHHETIGTIVPGKSKSHGEAQLFGKLAETIKGSTANHPLMPSEQMSLWDSFKLKVAESLPRLITAGKGVAQLMIGDYLGGFQTISGGLTGPSGNLITFPNSEQSRRSDADASRLLMY